jgi:RNA-dependent RNA polymerase
VTFRADEELIDGSGKRKSSTPGLNWFARVYQAIKHGILIDGRMYHFLCYSASNLRARKAWFLQLHKPTGQPLTCTSVLRGLGDFSLSASTIGKFVARIGQCFSKTTETVRVNKSKISVIPDSISSVNGKLYCSTDGCGEISVRIYVSTLMRKLAMLII